MKILFYVANAMVMPPAMAFASAYYKVKWKKINYRKLLISILLLSVTVTLTSLQFVFPEIIVALDRNKDALLSGEVWRLITPLFIQPQGLWQCLFNGIFFLTFLPVGEHLYKRRVLIIYFGAGLAGQLFNYYWSKGGGGSSTALYGVIGSLFAYILVNRKAFSPVFFFLAFAGFTGACILCFFQDGHAPALLVGGVIGLCLQATDRSRLQNDAVNN